MKVSSPNHFAPPQLIDCSNKIITIPVLPMIYQRIGVTGMYVSERVLMCGGSDEMVGIPVIRRGVRLEGTSSSTTDAELDEEPSLSNQDARGYSLHVHTAPTLVQD